MEIESGSKKYQSFSTEFPLRSTLKFPLLLNICNRYAFSSKLNLMSNT